MLARQLIGNLFIKVSFAIDSVDVRVLSPLLIYWLLLNTSLNPVLKVYHPPKISVKFYNLNGSKKN